MRSVVRVLIALLMAVGGVCGLEPLSGGMAAHAGADHHPAAPPSSGDDAGHWAACEPSPATTTGARTPGHGEAVAVRTDVPDRPVVTGAPPDRPGSRLSPERPPAFLLHTSLLI